MIKIQGLVYDVELTPPGLHSNFVGQTLPDDLRIMVSSTIHPQKQEEVLIHEITHMMVNQEPMVTNQVHEEFEGFVSRLATILYETLSDNGLLVDGWMDRLVDKRSEEVNADMSSKNVVEKNDNDSRTIEYSTDERLRRDGDDAKVLSGGQRDMGRYSQAGFHKRPTGSRRP